MANIVEKTVSKLRRHITTVGSKQEKLSQIEKTELVEQLEKEKSPIIKFNRQQYARQHFEKMMSVQRTKYSTGKFINSKVLLKIVKITFPFIKKIGKDETTKVNGSILDESEGGFEKHENEPTNVVEDKEEHAKAESESDSDSEFDNLLNPLLKELKQLAYPSYDSTGKFNDSYINSKKAQNLVFLFKIGKGMGLDETDENTDSSSPLTRYAKYSNDEGNEITSSLLCSRMGNGDQQD